jgi:perosamine synthetase
MIPRFKPYLGWQEFAAMFRVNRGAVEKFEKEFAASFGAADAVAFPYGRSAQWAFFKTLGIENAEIIMPAYTCSVVAHAVTLSGNTPRFIDISLDDYNMDLRLIPDAINENTRALIATHTFGYPQDIDRLHAIIKDAEKKYGHKIWLMQDCCHAFGARWNGKMIGTTGDVAVYAFNISKLMTSVFGGMLTFQNKELADTVRNWRNSNYKKPSFFKAVKRRLYLLMVYVAFHEKIYGITWWLQEKTVLLNKLTKSFHLDDKIHFPPDYLDKMLDIEAAVGLEQLKKYPEIIRRRRMNAEWYDKNLERKKDWIFPPLVDGATYSHYVIRVPDRQKAMNEAAKKGIQLGQLIEYSIPHMSSYEVDDLDISCKNSLLSSKQTINYPLYKHI